MARFILPLKNFLDSDLGRPFALHYVIEVELVSVKAERVLDARRVYVLTSLLTVMRGQRKGKTLFVRTVTEVSSSM